MEILQQKHWRGLPFPPPGDHPDSGIEPGSPTRPVWAGGFLTTVLPREAPSNYTPLEKKSKKTLPPALSISPVLSRTETTQVYSLSAAVSASPKTSLETYHSKLTQFHFC